MNLNCTAIRLMLALLWLLPVLAAAAEQRPEAAPAPAVPLGVSSYQPDKAFSGFTLYPIRKETVHLLSMDGDIVHEWRVPAVRARLLNDCRLLVVHDAKGLSNKVREYDWDGSVVWEYQAPAVVHHDVRRLTNGNTIMLYRKKLRVDIAPTEALPEPKQRKVRSDVIIEVTPAGETAWEWHAEKHLDLQSCRAINCTHPLESPIWTEKVRDWTHANTVQVLEDNRWHRAGDDRFRPGNVVLMARNLWTAMIIDRRTKDVVWEYTGDYRGGLSFPHESHMIADGLPGAGNVLIFDNGRGKRGSFILEVNPVTAEVVWVYRNGMRFYSKGQGSVQRLPNGNTLISEDDRGRVFEVTPDKEIVWQYKARASSRRAQRYGVDHCARLAEL